MRKEDFNDLLQGIREFKAIRSGTMKPSRVFDVRPVKVRAIRRRLHLSESQFAGMIGVSLSTLHKWEQGSRQPEGPARALLTVASKQPAAVLAALRAS
ncbi:MAG: helix-turn-helix domain-containing protein [Planctomycetota bacterium]